MTLQGVSDQVELLLKCDEQLQFTQEALQKSEISVPLRVKIHEQIDRIRQRQQDSKLYLAVVGEFSSGKSTFINALLRDELLKTSALVATTTATHLLYGEALTVEVVLKATQPEVIHTQPGSKDITVSWLPGIDQLDNRQFIHELTSRDEIARFVAHLDIKHPSSFLANQIVVIDTPGTNSESPEHGAITESIVRQEADLAVVVIPATAPLSQSLADFLGHTLKPCLHRCIFVVSRMDAIKPQDQSSLLHDLRLRLVNKLAISPPTLYPCAAQVVLDLLSGDEDPVPENLNDWNSQFTALEKIIIDRMNRERILSIAESLVRLLAQLFEQLDSCLRSQWQHYEARQAQINLETIPNLSEFTSEQYVICDTRLRRNISRYLSKVNLTLEIQRKDMMEKYRNKLFSSTSEDELAKFLNSQSEDFLQANQVGLKNVLDSLSQNLAENAIAVGKIFDQKFAEVYLRLQSIGGKLEASGNASTSLQVNSSNVIIPAQSLTRQLDSSDGAKMGIGATAGFFIGSALLPGLGSLVGLAIGTFASRWFMLSLEERKKQTWEKLEPSLISYYDAVEKQTQEAAIAYGQRLDISLKQRIDAYIEKYKVVIEDLLGAERAELLRLTEVQESTESCLAEIQRRKQKLIEMQKRLQQTEIKQEAPA